MLSIITIKVTWEIVKIRGLEILEIALYELPDHSTSLGMYRKTDKNQIDARPNFEYRFPCHWQTIRRTRSVNTRKTFSRRLAIDFGSRIAAHSFRVSRRIRLQRTTAVDRFPDRIWRDVRVTDFIVRQRKLFYVYVICVTFFSTTYAFNCPWRKTKKPGIGRRHRTRHTVRSGPPPTCDYRFPRKRCGSLNPKK